jgi:hypothetical protein
MKTKGIVKGLLLAAILFWVMVPCLGHAVPQKINYQGYLTDTAGIPINGSLQMVFSLYDVPSSGTPLWAEHQNVTVINGIYNVSLGDTVLIPLAFDVPYYLGITVGSDPEMTPRKALTSVGYAFRAMTADIIGVHTHSGADITSGIISEARIDPLITRNSQVMTIVKANDGPGSNLDADTLDGQHASAFITVVNAEATYVNVSGDSMSGAVADTVLSVNNTGTGETGDGVRGYTHTTSGSGVFGTASGTNGDGVRGYAHGTSGSGVYGYSSNNAGRGVYGLASGTYGLGVFGLASGTFGRGIYGYADNPGNGINYGGYFEAHGSEGLGVFSLASGTTGTNYGGHFEAWGTSGAGVYALATGTSGVGVRGTYFPNDNRGELGTGGEGVYGISTTGDGVKGESSGSGKSGVYGVSHQADGYGVYGGNFGGGYGVYGSVSSGTGVFGYSNNSFGMFAQSQQGVGLSAVHSDSGNYAHIGTAAAAIKATGTNGNAIEAYGDVYVEGAYKGNLGPNGAAPFPKPAYDSGWVSVPANTYIDLDTKLPPPTYSNDNFFIKLRARLNYE